MAKKRSTSKQKKSRYAAYRAEERRVKHKVNKLAHKIRHYKIQPPLILKGIKNTNKELAEKIKVKLGV